MNYTTYNINWLTLITAPVADSNSVTIEIMVKAGSIYEDKRTNGLSHFLEHMFFKGGKKYPTPHSVALALDAIGADYNAYTSDDYAGYYIKCAPLFLETAVDVLQDMMCETAFPEPELEREKGVITQEVMMYEDDPASLVWDKWSLAYYGDNSFGRSTLGTVENIQSFTRQDFIAHKRNLYTKDNLVITIAGRIEDEDGVARLVADAFDSLPDQKKVTEPIFTGVTNSQNSHYTKWTEQNHVIISLPGLDGSDQDKYALKVLTTVLGGNMSSRLFQRIREQEGLCYYIGAGHSASPQYGTIYFRAGMDKGRFAFAKDRMIQELDILAKEWITTEEFETTLNYLRGQTQMGIESSDSLAHFVGRQQLLYGEITTLDQQLERYESLTLEQVNTLKSMFASDKGFGFWIE